MDPLLSAALAPVLRDMATTAAPTPSIGRITSDDPPYVSTGLWGVDGSGAGVGIDTTESSVEQIVRATDQAQDWLIHELGMHRLQPTNWPVCPQHPSTHPLKPVARDDHAVWVCPASDEVIASIGDLQP